MLPTQAFFYALPEREEIAVDIDRGKTLVIRQTGTSELVDDEGRIKVFFELNGQPRLVRIAKLGAAPSGPKHPQADESNTNHLGAPMPGSVVTVAVHAGQKVAKGAPLVSIEAMKMETMLSADRDGTIKAVHVKPGDKVAAKDLLVEYA